MPTVHYTNRKLEWSHTIPTNAETINPNDDTQNNQDSDRASTPVISNTSTSISLKNETRIEGVTELDDRTVQLSMRINTNECSNHSQQSSASTSVTKTEQIKNSVDNHDNEFSVSTIDIKELGFSDVDAIKACLCATNGDPDAAVELLTSGNPPPKASDNTTLDVKRREGGEGVEANSSSVEIIVIDDTDDEESETEELTPSIDVKSSTTLPNVTSLSDDTEEVEAEAINNIKALGFQDSTAVKACLIASKGDSNIAVDYLLNGIPPNLKITGNNDTTACETVGSQDKMTLSSLQSKIRNVSSHQAKKSFGIRTMNGKPTLNRSSSVAVTDDNDDNSHYLLLLLVVLAVVSRGNMMSLFM